MPQGFLNTTNKALVGRSASIMRSLVGGHASCKAAALSLPVAPPVLQRCCTALLTAAAPPLQAGAASSLLQTRLQACDMPCRKA